VKIREESMKHVNQRVSKYNRYGNTPPDAHTVTRNKQGIYDVQLTNKNLKVREIRLEGQYEA
jgi:hypothetical protein